MISYSTGTGCPASSSPATGPLTSGWISSRTPSRAQRPGWAGQRQRTRSAPAAHRAEPVQASGQPFTDQEPHTRTLTGTPTRPSLSAATTSPRPPGPGSNPIRPLVPKRPLVGQGVAGNSPVYSHGCKFIPPVAQPAIRRMDRGLRPVAPHRDLELIWNGVVDTSGGRR